MKNNRLTLTSGFSCSLKRIFPTAIAIASLLLAPFQSAKASFDGARFTAAVLFDALRRAGWTVRNAADVGLLPRGRSVIIRTTLHAGNVYKIAAAGCEDAADVDVAVFDENGNFIDGDNDFQKLAVADIVPKWTGTFLIKVTMADSTPDGAHFVVQYAFTKR
jgi:hypothetical protein